MSEMFRTQLPRVYELIDLIANPNDPKAYFQGFDQSIRDEPLKLKAWCAREREFQRLDKEAWQFMKEEALPYLSNKDENGRGWQQLVDILNQARGYIYLVDSGCGGVRFIPRSSIAGNKTPELEAWINDGKVLCEVKTINISDLEIDQRTNGTVGSPSNVLAAGFMKKLMDDISHAKQQMDSHVNAEATRKIVYIVINFDDFVGDCNADNFQQIDTYLAEYSIPGLEVVFHPPETCIRRPVAMRHAFVANDPG